jgi:hypothetical protein
MVFLHLDLMINSQVHYHCAPATVHLLIIFFYGILFRCQQDCWIEALDLMVNS